MTTLNFELLSIAGLDRERFVQGLITADITKLTETQASLAALCDTKGRIIANFIVFKTVEAIYFILPHRMAELTQKALKKYALFSKVTLNNDTAAWHFIGSHRHATEKPLFALTIENDSFKIQYPHRSLTLCKKKPANTEDPINQNEWQLADINDGIATIQPETSGLFTPQMINLDKLNGISFNKGCYLGQEIVARTQHLGKLKRHLKRIEFKTNTHTQCGNAIITDDNNTVGQLLNHAKINSEFSAGLAVIEDRALNQALFVGQSKVNIIDQHQI